MESTPLPDRIAAVAAASAGDVAVQGIGLAVLRGDLWPDRCRNRWDARKRCRRLRNS